MSAADEPGGSVECALSVSRVEEQLREIYDVDAMRDGLAKLLRQQGHGAPRGSEAAGLTIRQLQEGLRRERGLPILAQVTYPHFEAALARMVADAGDEGLVVQAGKALYGYDEAALPTSLSDGWRAWLKAYAPEPPAKEDVKQRVRQALAQAGTAGLPLRDLTTSLSHHSTTPSEVSRAVAELVNDREAAVEQEEDRYPDDGTLHHGALREAAQVWLNDYAPPDDRAARRRIRELVQEAGEEGRPWGQVKAHLQAEGIALPAAERAVERLMQRAEVTAYEPDAGAMLHDSRLLTDAHLLRLPQPFVYPPPPADWQTFRVDIPAYRLPANVGLLLGEFRSRVPEDGQVTEVVVTARPGDAEADPLFGSDEQAAQMARVQAEHRLTWQFEPSTTKDALLNLTQRLLKRLGDQGEVIVEAVVYGRKQTQWQTEWYTMQPSYKP